MYRIIILLLISLKTFSQDKNLDDIYSNINNKENLFEEIYGKFYYTSSNREKGIYKSEFILESETKQDMERIYYVATNLFDTLFINKNIFLLKDYFKYYPLSMKIYFIQYNEKHFKCITGKAQSACGSGLERTFYMLFKKKNNDYILINSFESRFGNIKNIGDFNDDGKLDYMKIIRKGKYYNLDFRDLKGNSLNMGNMILEYKLNDKFKIIKNNLKDIKFN
ncbi:hypothetical protein [Vallitalea sp.]|jgi:hypothetical protein|uniref:hypothetical protein n=1 Tax=Vallitalea sp. TaxID=1882829 RepID=UPI0025FE8BA0|nr:hypothetical protein [Vallitalea sp.]MCT4688498.1 hypothetical protein [Vallitalea sp.]